MPGVVLRGDAYTAAVGDVLVGARYGFRPDFEWRLRLRLVPLAKGIVGVEGGGVYHVRVAHGLEPGLHLTSDLSVLTSPRFYGSRLSNEGRGALGAAVLADVAPLAWVRPYVVADQALIFYDGRYVLSLFTGVQLLWGRFELSLETGVVDVNEPTRRHTQPYLGVFGRGALWASWGLAYRFGVTDEGEP